MYNMEDMIGDTSHLMTNALQSCAQPDPMNLSERICPLVALLWAHLVTNRSAKQNGVLEPCSLKGSDGWQAR